MGGVKSDSVGTKKKRNKQPANDDLSERVPKKAKLAEKEVQKDRREIMNPYRHSSSTAQSRIHIMFDGGSRGNPGIAGSGAAVTFHSKSSSRTVHLRHFVGNMATNNEAEYFGLVWGLRVALKMHESMGSTLKILIQGDSQLIIKQLKGEYKCKNSKLRPFYDEALQILNRFRDLCNSTIQMEHVYRNLNARADGKMCLFPIRASCFLLSCTELANEAMDARRSWLTTSDDNHESQQPLPKK